MARARSLKPGFFINEELAECSALARLLFAGLWTIADREGRLEDRPKRIKAELLPYDDCDPDELLGQLHGRGFIERYTVDGAPYIQVVKFTDHQNPHVKEAPSKIPPRSGIKHATPVLVPDKPGTSTVQALDKNTTNRALTLNPITGSGIWDPHSGEGTPAGANGADAPPPEDPDMPGNGGEPEEPDDTEPRKKRAHELPEDFAPNETDCRFSAEHGINPAVEALELEKFRLHYEAHGKPMKDWHAAWRNWLLKVPDFAHVPARASPNSDGNRFGPKGPDASWFAAEARRLEALGE